jgi:hypothetical protein
MEIEPWRGHPVAISAHAVIRWLERIEGVELGPLRRLAGALFQSKKASDKAMLRVIETGFGLSLDPIRLRIRRAFDEGEPINRPNKSDIVLPGGYALGVVKNPDGTLVVLTVLEPGMLLRPASTAGTGEVGMGDVPEGQGDPT